MLLDTNSPDLPPASHADRPARTEPQPDSRDNYLPVDQRADAALSTAQPGNDAPNANGRKAEADSGKDGDVANDAAATGDGKSCDAETAVAAGIDQIITDFVAACAPGAPAQIVAGPAVATDTAPNQTEASQADAAVVPVTISVPVPKPIGPAPAEATSAEQLAPAQSATGNQPADMPAETAKANAPAALTELANVTAPAKSTAPAAQNTAPDPAEGKTTAEPNIDTAATTSAAAATPAKPAEKFAVVGRIESAAPAETSAPNNEATTAAPAVVTTPAKPAPKIASAEGAAPAIAANAQTPAESRSNPAAAKVEASNPNLKPAIVAANGETAKEAAKNDGAKSEGELANGQAHRPAAEQTASAEPKADPVSRIADSVATKVHAETAQLPTSSVPAPQTVAATPAIMVPAVAAVAAIPLAALPVEIVAHAKAGNNRFEIRLDPPELGRIDVRLDIDRSGHVTSRLMVERPETLDLLRRDAHSIERALQDAGLKTSDQGMQFSLRGQSFADQNDDTLPRAANLLLPADDIVALEAIRQGYGRLLGLGGGIDIRV